MTICWILVLSIKHILVVLEILLDRCSYLFWRCVLIILILVSVGLLQTVLQA